MNVTINCRSCGKPVMKATGAPIDCPDLRDGRYRHTECPDPGRLMLKNAIPARFAARKAEHERLLQSADIDARIFRAVTGVPG